MNDNTDQPGCPYCRMKPKTNDDQPYPGTHAFSVKYLCGSQVVYTIGDPGGYWEWEDECPEMKISPEEIDDGK